MKDNIIQFPVDKTKITAEHYDEPPDTWHDKISADLLQEHFRRGDPALRLYAMRRDSDAR